MLLLHYCLSSWDSPEHVFNKRSDMQSSIKKSTGILCFIIVLLGFTELGAQVTTQSTELDVKVQKFLEQNRNQWRDLNIPYSDGQLLYDIIVENGYTKGVEIGTSTGHSTIWIAWAMSKTGGKVITIEIDEDRYQEALQNFEEAGVLEFIDARLGNAHNLVPELEGPVDFVFSDADKDWYIQYFKDIDPILEVGGCFTAHNVRPANSGRGMRGTRDYLRYVQGLSTYTTTVNNSGGGLAISYKK